MNLWIDKYEPTESGYIWRKSTKEAIDILLYYKSVYESELASKNPDKDTLRDYKINSINIEEKLLTEHFKEWLDENEIHCKVITH